MVPFLLNDARCKTRDGSPFLTACKGFVLTCFTASELPFSCLIVTAPMSEYTKQKNNKRKKQYAEIRTTLRKQQINVNVMYKAQTHLRLELDNRARPKMFCQQIVTVDSENVGLL